MSVQIRYRLSPIDEWTYAEINRDDPFEVCNAVRTRLFPNTPLPEHDERFEAVMNRRQAGARERGEGGGREAPAVATGSLPGVGVRDTSMAAYRTLEWHGRLTKQQAKVVDFLQANLQRDYTRQELSNVTGLAINAICGRVRELLDLKVLEETGPRECRITGATANPLRLALWMRKAA